MQPRRHCRKPPPPRWSSCDTGVPTPGPHATLMSSFSTLPDAAPTQQPLRPSLRMPSPVLPHRDGAPAVAAFASPTTVSSSAFPLPADSTLLSVHSTASGSTPRIDVRDVAELVRHLAESRYMTRQLQQRVHEMESSFTVKAAALGDSTMSVSHTQRSTATSAQAGDERLATSGDAEADVEAEQAAPPDYPTQEKAPRGRRRRTANARGGESTRTGSPACVRSPQRTRTVSAAFRQARSGDSHSPRTRHRCSSSATSSLVATGSTSASATTSRLPSTSPPSSIAESPLRRVLPSPSSQCASNGVSSTASSRHRRRRTSQRQCGPRRTRSAPERPRQRARSSSVNRGDTTAGVPRTPEKQRRRSSAVRRRGHTRSQKRHHRRADQNDGHTTTAPRGRGEACSATHVASVSLARHRRRSSATGSGHHRRSRSFAAEAARGVCISRWPPPPAALPALNGTRDSSSQKGKVLVWQRRYYDLLARYTDETKRRDADLADIHEMIECISWEQDQSRHCHGQCRHTRTVVRELEDSVHLASRGGAASRDCTQEAVDEAGTAGDEHAVVMPQAVAHAANGGKTRTKDADGDPSGHTTADEAVTPVHDSLEYVEALRCEADAWRQRCLALLRQQQLGTEVTRVSDASVAPLPPRPSSAAAGRSPLSADAAPSSHAEYLTSTTTLTMADEEAVVVPGGGDGACGRGASTAAAHRIESAARGNTSPPPPPSHSHSTPTPVAEQTTQRLSQSASPGEAAVGTTSSSAHHLYHPYALSRLASGSHVSSVGAANFNARIPTPLPPPSPSSARQPVQLLSVAPTPSAGFLSPAASSPHLSPGRPPLFAGVPGYESLITRAGSHAAWPSQFLAPPPADKAPPFSASTGVAFPSTASVFFGAPFFDASESSPWGDVTRGGVQQVHGRAARSAPPWLLDATLRRERDRNLPASSPISVHETLMPYPHASSLFHGLPPSSSMAAELVVAREQLERDIRRHDQLLAAIGKLQKTAAEHPARRAL